MWHRAFSSTVPTSQIPFREWFGMIMEVKNLEEVETLCVCAWKIWGTKNDLYFEKIYAFLDVCYRRALDILLEFRKASDHGHQEHLRRSNSKWAPPEQGSIKVNVDATINVKEDKVGLGVVARDSNGIVFLSASKTIWPAYLQNVPSLVPSIRRLI